MARLGARALAWAWASALALGVLVGPGVTPAHAETSSALSGRVTTVKGEPLAGAQIELRRWTTPADGFQHVAAASTAEDGRYSFAGLPDGRYAWVVWAPDGYLSLPSAEFAIEGRDSTKDIVLTVESRASGVVLSADGRPLSGVGVSAHRLDPGRTHPSFEGYATTDADGRFTVLRLPAGRYTLEYDHSRYGYAAEYTGDHFDLESATYFTLAVGETVTGKNAELVRGARISGTVRGQDAGTLDRVEVDIQRVRADGQRSTVEKETGTYGSYEARVLPPGTYEISFNPRLHQLIHDIPPEQGFLRGRWVDTQGRASFTLGPSEAVVRDITLLRFGQSYIVDRLPRVVGTPRVGEQLTVEDPVVRPAAEWVTYEWLRDGKPVLESSGYAYYGVTGKDVGARISVRSTAHGYGYRDEVITSAATGPVPTPVPLRMGPVPTPVIKGIGLAGRTLEVVPGSWPRDISMSFRWRPDGADVPGTEVTEQRYRVRQSDKGKTLTVEVFGSMEGYHPESRTSAGLYIPRALSVSRPSIQGSASTGSTLRARATGVTPGAAVAYRWYANGKRIAGASGSSFTPSGSQRGKRITVKVTASHAGYSSVTQTSRPTSKVARAATPRVTGKPEVGSTLKVSQGSWTAKTSFSYQWLRDGAAIKGATRSRYKVTSADAGRHLAVKVTGKRKGYSTASRTSGTVVVRSAK